MKNPLIEKERIVSMIANASYSKNNIHHCIEISKNSHEAIANLQSLRDKVTQALDFLNQSVIRDGSFDLV